MSKTKTNKSAFEMFVPKESIDKYINWPGHTFEETVSHEIEIRKNSHWNKGLNFSQIGYCVSRKESDQVITRNIEEARKYFLFWASSYYDPQEVTLELCAEDEDGELQIIDGDPIYYF